MQHPDDWLMERFKVLAELQQWLGFRRVWGWIPGRTSSVFAWSFLNDCLVSLQLRDVLEAVPPGLLIAPPCEAAAEDQADPNRNGCSGISVLPSTRQRTLRARGRAEHAVARPVIRRSHDHAYRPTNGRRVHTRVRRLGVFDVSGFGGRRASRQLT